MPETVADVVAAFKKAFDEERRKKIEATVLPPGVTLNEFYRVGLEQFGAEIFSRIYHLIETVELDVSFLVCGFSEGSPCIFTYSDPGKETNYDLLGFWAIGGGTNSAIGSLFNLKEFSVIHRSLKEVIYRVCEAKFFAESAPGVGKQTSALILESSGRRYLLKDVEPIRTLWEANSSRPLPSGANDIVTEVVNRSAPKNLDTA